MRTLQIVGNSPEAINFFEYARTLPFVREKRTKKEEAAESALPPAPPCQYATAEEFRNRVREAVDEYRATGVSFSQEEMERWASRL